jgi:hypothetical protein
MERLKNPDPALVEFIQSLEKITTYMYYDTDIVARFKDGNNVPYLFSMGDISDDRAIGRDLFYEFTPELVVLLEGNNTSYVSILEQAKRVIVIDYGHDTNSEKILEAQAFTFEEFSKLFGDLIPNDRDHIFTVYE